MTGVITWALFVPAADWLAQHDIGSATGTLLETARTNARSGLLTLTAGLVAAAALVFTARNSILSRRTYELTEQGQVTERYTKAIEQLGSDKVDVRIGGVYALERIARDSSRDHPTVLEVLTAFIREHSRDMWPVPTSDCEVAERSTRPDVQAAVDVVGRRDPEHDIRPVDLARVNLTGANLRGVNLRGAFLPDADLRGTDLRDADLSRAELYRAELSGADLGDANLADAGLAEANLSGADLTGTDLTGALLGGADLTNAKFSSNFHDVPNGWILVTGVDLWSRPGSGLGYLRRP